MFKGFQNTSKSNGFNGFPALNFQMNNEAYGFSGCNTWFDAAIGLPHSNNLTSISYWFDKISNKKYIQNTAANQPRLLTSDPDFNNLPSIDFTQSDVRQMNSSDTISPLTFAVIVRAPIIKSFNRLFGDSSSNLNFWLGGSFNSGITGIGFYNLGNADFVTNVETTTTNIIIATENNIVINGNTEATSTRKTLGRTDYRVMGSLNVNNIGYFKISEFISFSRIMTEDEMKQLSANINTKYAIY